MSIRVGINGYGRIGRNILRALYESGREKEIQIVAINDIGDLKASAHLTRYDSAHGPFNRDVAADDEALVVGNDRIRFTACRNPADIPWKESEVDVVIESTGLFASREKSQGHLDAGAPRVLISAPAGTDVDATVVYGVNHEVLSSKHTVISNASCTTNCLAPMAKVLLESVGLKSGVMTTIHSYTNDQVLTDVAHSDLRRARSATQSMIPTATGAARAVGLVLPELKGRLDGFAMRVPTINVSVVDLSFVAERECDVDTLNAAMRKAAEGPMKGVLAYNELPLVSIDFNHNPASSVYDAGLTKVMPGNLVKVLSWYDNEWGFSNRMLDVIVAWNAAA